jgi:hypothetical protein
VSGRAFRPPVDAGFRSRAFGLQRRVRTGFAPVSLSFRPVTHQPTGTIRKALLSKKTVILSSTKHADPKRGCAIGAAAKAGTAMDGPVD